MTILHNFIAVSNDVEGIRELLRLGENPNIPDFFGVTPLHKAVSKSAINPQDIDEILIIARELINFGANVNKGNYKKQTALHMAVGCRIYKMIEMLLQQNAEINQEDIKGKTALHYATSKRRFHLTDYDLDLGVVKLLLKNNPEIDKQSQNGETALMLAVRCGNLQIVRKLLKNNASVNLQNTIGNSAMTYALERPEVDENMVLELVRGGCSFNTTNNSGMCSMSLYLRELRYATITEVEKAKFVSKLYILVGNAFTSLQKKYIKEIIKERRCQLYRYILLCHHEFEKMKTDALSLNYKVYDIALRGAHYNVYEANSHVPLEVFDRMLDKLIKHQYPLYCDLIALGICRPYMNKKFADWICNIKMNNKELSSDVIFKLSCYLSNIEMLNMMIAFSLDRKPSRFLPRFTFSMCSVS